MSGNWQLACNVSDLTAGARDVLEVLIGQRVLAIFKTETGYWAVDGMCAHQGGPIAKGTVDGCCVTCPWHGWQYDVTDGRNLLTGRKMLATYPVQLRGEQLWVEVPD